MMTSASSVTLSTVFRSKASSAASEEGSASDACGLIEVEWMDRIEDGIKEEVRGRLERVAEVEVLLLLDLNWLLIVDKLRVEVEVNLEVQFKV